MVDVEADGPCPGLFSMISFGAVIVDGNLNQTFYGKLKPISDDWVPEALSVSGYSREETLEFDDPKEVMRKFDHWLYHHHERLSGGKGRLRFIADNPGFDWQFINYYFWRYCNKNPFGHSQNHLGDLYKGMEKDMFKSFKYLRDTRHTHNPVDDAIGNAEALLKMKKMGLGIKF